MLKPLPCPFGTASSFSSSDCWRVCAHRTTGKMSANGRRTDVMGDNPLEAPGTPREAVRLNAYRELAPSGQGKYYLSVTYMARNEVGYLDIAPGPTLTLIVDGQPTKLNGSGSFNRRKA